MHLQNPRTEDTSRSLGPLSSFTMETKTSLQEHHQFNDYRGCINAFRHEWPPFHPHFRRRYRLTILDMDRSGGICIATRETKLRPFIDVLFQGFLLFWHDERCSPRLRYLSQWWWSICGYSPSGPYHSIEPIHCCSSRQALPYFAATSIALYTTLLARRKE
jgi:hypothetical protein